MIQLHDPLFFGSWRVNRHLEEADLAYNSNTSFKLKRL